MRNGSLLIVVLVGCSAMGQNLLPNGSFEDVVDCPDSPGQLERSLGWQKFRGTPDFFHPCSPNAYCAVPNNAFGYQQSADGSAYVGLLTYDSSNVDAREYAGIQLLEPLTPGIMVNVSLQISPGGWGWYVAQRFRYSASGIGVFFTTNPWSGTEGPIPNYAPLHLVNPQLDTAIWYTLSGSYVPDSAYSYLVIGNFFRDTLLSLALQDPSAAYPGAYTFIDDVSVEPADVGVQEMIDQRTTGVSGICTWPNPCGSELNISRSGSVASALDCALLDVSGRVCRMVQFRPGESELRVDVSDLPDGSFLLQPEEQPIRRVRVLRLTSY